MPVRVGLAAAALICGLGLAGWGVGSARAADPAPPPQRQQIEQIIHDYIMAHPDVLVSSLRQVEDKLHKDDEVKASKAVDKHKAEVFNDPAAPVGGNPRGDVTVVEFFDYRCPYCKQVEPSLKKMLQQDPQLRLVYKEFPILGPASVTAARAALAAKAQGKYDQFHAAMMEAHGPITNDTVYRVAGSVGLDIDKLKRDMAAPEVSQALKSNLKLADALDIRGTPAFVIGDKVVPGAIDLDALKGMVSNARGK
jgi:protein-disulfide isomerase